MSRGYAAVREQMVKKPVVATAIGHTQVALATDTEVLVVSSEDEMVVTLQDPPRAVALGSALVVAHDDRLVAYRCAPGDADVLWECDVDGVVDLVSLDDADCFIARTSGGDLVGVDSTDGSERFRLQQPHADVAEKSTLVGGSDRVVLGAWLYLSLFDRDGTLEVDPQLDGVITDVGIVDDVAVALLKDGRLVGVDCETGERQWVLTADAEWITARGTDSLVAGVGGEVVEIDRDGTQCSLAGFDTVTQGDTVVAAASGDPYCLVAGRSVTVYRPHEETPPLDVWAESSSLSPDTPLTVGVDNTTDERIEGLLELSSESVTFVVDRTPVTIAARETQHVEVPVEAVDRDDTTVDVAYRVVSGVTDEAAPLVSGQLSCRASKPSPSDSDRPDVDAKLSLETIEEGEFTGTLTLENTGTAPLSNVTVVPEVGDLGSLDVGETQTYSVSVPVDTAALTVSTDINADSVRLASIDITEPQSPLFVEIDPADEDVSSQQFVDVTVRNVASVPVTDTVTVAGPLRGDQMSRTLTLSSDSEVLLVLPLAGGGDTVSVTTSTVEVTESIDVTPDSPASSRRHPDASANEPAADRVPTASTPTDASLSADPAVDDFRQSRSEAPEPPAERSVPADVTEADLVSSVPETTDTDTAQDEPRSAPTSTDSPDTSGEESPVSAAEALRVERSLSTDSVQQGLAFEETVTLTTDGPEVAVDLAGQDGAETRLTVGEEPVVLKRHHVAYSTGELTIPETPLAEDIQTEPVTLTVEPSPLVIRSRISLTTSDAQVTLDLESSLGHPCGVTRMQSRGFDAGHAFDDAVVPVGERRRFHGQYRGSVTTPAVLTAVELDVDGARKILQTVSPVVATETTVVDVDVHAVDRLGDGECNVALTVTNGGVEPLTVHVEAEGGAPDEYLYSPEERRLEPEESFEHRIECTVDSDAVELPIMLTASNRADEERASETVTVAGMVGDEAADWTVTYPTTDPEGTGSAVVSTPLTRPDESGSP